MRIKSISLKNFTIFTDFQLDVNSGINIFVGENGTGKTHLLKAIYAACESSKVESTGDELLKCFKENQQKGDLLKDKNDRKLEISIKSEDDENLALKGTSVIPPSVEDLNRFAPAVKPFNDSKYLIYVPHGKQFFSVYIPVKDMLTHSAGLLAMANKYRDFPFDKTLTDIVVKASQWKVNQPSKLARDIMKSLTEMMYGVVVFENDEFYVKKKSGNMVRFELEAEGLKKIGLLWQLLMTDNLTEDSILIWDEPEANLNPKFLPQIVECLLKLSRHGVQIFLSTHNYIFAKYFNVRAKDSDSVMFHALYLENEDVKVESNRIFSSLKKNAIMQTFNQLLDEVYNFDMGD